LLKCGQQPRFLSRWIVPGRAFCHGAMRTPAACLLQYDYSLRIDGGGLQCVVGLNGNER
jgi:hypothetical protein